MAERERMDSFDRDRRAFLGEEPFEEFADAALSDRVKAAYDQVVLPEDSFERMRAILAAQQEAAAEHDRVVRRKPHVLRFALSAAACLAVAAIAGIVAFNAPMQTSESPDPVAAEAVSEESAVEGNDEANGTGATSEAPEAAPEDSSDVGEHANGEAQVSHGEGFDAAAATQNLAYQSPVITLASGAELGVATDAQGNPQEADADDIVQYLEGATARAEGSNQAVACAIYVTANGSYAATFEDDPTYYLLQ
jgi:hypothetical protein